MPILDSICGTWLRHGWRGAHRISGALCGTRRLLLRSRHGLQLELDRAEYVDSFVIRFGYYEEEVLEAILHRMRPSAVFWDVGANIGLHALTVSKLVSGARVVAFEPNPVLATLMRSAAIRNKTNVEVSELALDCKTGAAHLYLHDGNLGRSSLVDWASARRDVLVTLGIADQLAYSQPYPTPNVMKIDVEGCEARVLAGMTKMLARKDLHTVVFEDREGESPSKDVLKRAGFEIRQLARMGPTGHNLENFVAERFDVP